MQGIFMRSKSFTGMTCSIAGALEVIGDRWSILILRDLSFGLSKYEDLRKSTEVTNATLSDRLKNLEENGLITRRLYQTSPDRYEYVLTRKGRDTRLLTQTLAQIGDSWAVTGDDGPPMRLTNRKTGARVKIAMVDERTGETVEIRDLLPKAGPGADDLIHWRLKHLKEKRRLPPQ
jgi:DNA-binding HxlR family transcriptional regulator